jgi:hypothetical protein
VYVQPRASRTEVVGWQGDALKIRLAAPPVDGAANRALVRFLAKMLAVSSREVTIVAGASSRRKRVAVSSLTQRQALQRLGVAPR